MQECKQKSRCSSNLNKELLLPKPNEATTVILVTTATISTLVQPLWLLS